MSLDSGGLRHTFAPETPMVMAMALNELCQYPESVRAIGLFKRDYEKPYKWLSTWSSQTKHEPLYPTVVKFLRKQAPDVPDRVGSEWVRSLVFITDQDELNLIIDEVESTKALGKSGAKEQKKIASEARALALTLKGEGQDEGRRHASPGRPQ
jgi:hypothetical protein